MSTGYGRGYYGENQLAKAPRRGGSTWIKIALVVGVGAVVWLMWPRRSSTGFGRGDDPKPPPPPPSPPPPGGQFAQSQAQLPGQAFVQSTSYPGAYPAQAQLPYASVPVLPPAPSSPPLLPPSSGPAPADQQVQITQHAQSRGYPSSKEYEDAVVASAKQLQDSGAKVVLAPHLAHLTPRLGS